MDDVAVRILIVDDAGLVRRFHRNALEKAGFAVWEALNGVEALEKVLAVPVDLVVLDINMPQMDGLTFLKALRSREEPCRAVPVLMISTEAGEHDREAARAAGANFYLVKPVAPELLVEHVALMCGAKR